ncbi:metal ABC transporter solute-binding protein, Zn/Mn family [Treponema sp. R6D11]
MMKKFTIFAVFISLLLFSACTRQTALKDGLLIALSIQPQAWFVSQIAGDKATTITFLPPGQNQHTFEPTPKQIQTLASADAWILSGAEFEIGLRPKVEKVFPNLLIVDGAEGVKFRLITEDESGGLHNSLELDRHTWLGREPAKILAAHVRDTLCIFDKKNAKYYNEHYKLTIDLIDKEFESLEITLAPLRGKNIFVYHPCFGYFFDEFGIKQSAVEVGGKEPTPRELNNLVTKINEGHAVAIIVQTQFPTGAAKTLAAATGLEIISLDPFATDWLANINQIGNALTRCIR